MKTKMNAVAAGAAMSGRITRRQRVHRPGAEVLRRLEQSGRDRPEAGEQHEHDVRQEDVDERDGDGEAVVEQEARAAGR